MAVVSGELEIYFTYELMPKATKQKDLIAKAYGVLKPLIESDDRFKNWKELLMNAVKADRSLMDITWLQKHLNDYTAKNSFDYFIHKDLGGFLRRELDFYVKNEVLVIDDLTSAKMKSTLAIVKAIEQVGNKIITFLAQLEDFQKKLWLKKKFVVGCDYCITLDRIPESMYSEIVANDEQRKEWVRLFAIDEIKGDLTTEAYSEPLTIEFLKQNPFLVLDTKFFSLEFKHKLLATMENIDGQCNGLLVNSENFQALKLLKSTYCGSVKTVYIDPPYNTGDDGFCYKDALQHSSWLTMMYDRLYIGKLFLKDDGTNFVSMSDNELSRLKDILEQIYSSENFEGHIHWRRRHNQPNDKTKMLGIVAEHLIVYANNSKTYKAAGVGKIGITGKFTNPDKDPKGPWASKPWKVGSDQSGSRYVITSPTGVVFDEEWMGDEDTYKEFLAEGRIYFPKNGNGAPRKKYYEFERNEEGQCATNWWPHDQFGCNQFANDMMTGLFGIKNKFSNPKPLELIEGIIQVSNCNENNIIMDYFAGSGTTAHATIISNREDNGNRRYLLDEMGEYFDDVTKPRVEKVIYSSEWNAGKPTNRQGISQCFKYIRLEQYEDTLNNLVPKQSMPAGDDDFQESYMLGYMLDTDTRGSLLNLKMFKHPFDVKIKTTKDNELVETPVDMVETFNYLIGLNVETESWHHDGDICVVEGKTHIGNENTLVIWRDCEKIDNDALNEFFRKQDFNTLDMEYDVIYVNGDNTLPNVRRDEDHWKVVLTEDEFKARMFEED